MSNINLSEPIKIFLDYSTYNLVPNAGTISATSLLRPTRQFILNKRNPTLRITPPLNSLVASRVGQSVHSSIENVLKNDKYMDRRYGKENYIVNPTEDEDLSKYLNVFYTEIRSNREMEIDGKTITISGEFDVLHNGTLEDFKYTKVFQVMSKTKDEDYKLQLSIYRWLNPDKEIKDIAYISFLLADWKAYESTREGYPPPTESKEYELYSLEETEAIIRELLTQKLADYSEEDLPLCSDKELWMNIPVKTFKYYSKIDSKRATKVFTGDYSDIEANDYLAERGTGVVRQYTPPVIAKACNYCSVKSVCTQYTDLFNNGLIKED